MYKTRITVSCNIRTLAANPGYKNLAKRVDDDYSWRSAMGHPLSAQPAIQLMTATCTLLASKRNWPYP